MTLAEAKKLEKCNHDDCLRDGVRPNCWSYQEPPPTIQDAKKTMENWKRYLWGHFDGPDKFTSNLPDLENLIKQLIEASAIIAASEQREKDWEEIDNLFGWVVTPFIKQKPITPYEIYLWEKLNEVRNKARKQILNQDSQQTISSKKSE